MASDILLLSLCFLLGYSMADFSQWENKTFGQLHRRKVKDYSLPVLPYRELNPVIDRISLKVHYQGHHKAYEEKMNAVLKEWREEVSSEFVSL